MEEPRGPDGPLVFSCPAFKKCFLKSIILTIAMKNKKDARESAQKTNDFRRISFIIRL